MHRALVTAVTPQPLHRALGLTDGELERICDLLGRDPNDFELAVYSLLWSEHCGYKHSRPLLGRFPTSGSHVLQGPGENAGVIDVGDGLAVALKVESHNHPSAVEPFQGRPPASAASCATSSRWAPARSPSWTRFASASSRRSTSATCSPRSW